MIKKSTLYFLSYLLLMSCSDSSKKDSNNLSAYGDEAENNSEYSKSLFFDNDEKSNNVVSKNVGDFYISVDLMGSLEFLTRKNEKIEQEDLKDLEKESLLLMEISNKNIHQDILENEDLELSKDSTIQYLVGGLQKDVYIEQEEKEIVANSVIYEGRLGEKNKLRVMFLFNGVNRNKSYKIIYNDHLFNKGIVKFKVNKNLES